MHPVFLFSESVTPVPEGHVKLHMSDGGLEAQGAAQAPETGDARPTAGQ